MNELAIRLIVAALGGLAVGIEREWSIRAAGRSPRFAGVRTFTLLGIFGALSVIPQWKENAIVGFVLLGAAALLVCIAYGISAFSDDVDATTEVAAIIVLATGALSGTGQLAIASAINAFTALVLMEKTRIHSLVFKIQSEELEAAFRFAVLALVVLPILPPGPYGPSPGIRPRELWTMVLIFSGLSFAGYLARRIVGPKHGHQIAGMLGGLISSTAVSLTFSNESRSSSALGRSLAFGVIGACIVLFFRTPILAFILNPSLGMALIPYVVIPVVIGIGILVYSFWKKPPKVGEMPQPKNPLRLGPAIQMAVVFQIVLYLMDWVSKRFGSGGILATSALLGFTDVDALTFSMSKLGISDKIELAAQGLAVGILSNTFLKLGIVLIVGRDLYRRIAAIGLIALAIGSILGLIIIPYWK